MSYRGERRGGRTANGRHVNMPGSRGQRKKGGCGGCLVIIIGVIVLSVCIWKGWSEWWPGHERAESEMTQVEQPLTYNGTWSGYGTTGQGNDLLIPVPALDGLLPVTFEAESDTVILTSPVSVASMPLDQLGGMLNGSPKEWPAAAVRIGETVHVPASVLEELYGIEVKQYPANGAVQFGMPGQTLQSGTIVKLREPEDTVPMRQGSDKKSPIIADLKSESAVTIWEESGDWLRVEADDGTLGYVAAEDILPGDAHTVPKTAEARVPQFVEEKTPVSLAWEAVYSRNPDPSKLPDMPGTNVISPTWFSLEDEEGNVLSKADMSLTEWAHRNGKQVWALYSNSFEPERTTEALSTFERRNRTIGQLLALADRYQADGINLDFENVNVEDRNKLTQFVRELVPRLHAKGLVVSIDVTAKSDSGRWSQFLDREALGKLVDYMMVMAYDEHWAASPVAGSVASLPWTEQAVTRIMNEDSVPAHKLVLGMPLYTRIWTEEVQDGETKVSSKALGMQSIQDILTDKKLKPQFDESAGQHYVEYKEEGNLQRIWIEDERSVRARIELADRLGLGGIAVWARTFASDDIWDVLRYPPVP
ncbi:glycosyl hydrolase family 18 protein [Paenibacillus dendritiformis]|uniref:Glycoside hydrolase n=1 Tax=Paenibacillus dendritiformis C454 TaxID=1131935 RepID=H3SGF4_9BACL|nr:glycosyl hydrolase family 18 protein [Paenibacillus dendritiformis]EHQ61791.1 glycoside hydrolase [Paenibacillus dendritiformis C454]CAH8769071.1 glycosyl hydrolase family 18 protein [Paenibacillus dendritiformis]